MDKLQNLGERIDSIESQFDDMNSFFDEKSKIDNQRIKNQKVIIICITLVLIVSLLVNAFCLYEMSQYENVVEEYEIVQETNDNSNIVNGNQYNDSSTHEENK